MHFKRTRASQILSGLRRLQRLLSIGLAEQFLLSGSSFLFTAQISKSLSPTDFGLSSVIWSVVILLETSLWGFFGDAVSATFARCPGRTAPSLRGALVILSTIASTIIALVMLMVALVSLSFVGLDIAISICAGAVTFIFMRAQNIFRRICFIEQKRISTLLGAIIYAITLYILSRYLKIVQFVPAAVALIIAGASSAASILSFFFSGCKIQCPSVALIRWLVLKLWDSGRWVVLSSAISWAGNLGVIPLAGIFGGLGQSGAFRTVQTVIAPMGQATNVVQSVLVPDLSLKARAGQRVFGANQLIGSIALFVLVTFPYSLLILLFGASLYKKLFGNVQGPVTGLVLGIAVIGYCIESIKMGVNTSLLATGRTKFMLYSQILSILSLLAILPILVKSFGFMGLVLATTLANNVGTILLLVYWVHLRKSIFRV